MSGVPGRRYFTYSNDSYGFPARFPSKTRTKDLSFIIMDTKAFEMRCCGEKNFGGETSMGRPEKKVSTEEEMNGLDWL